MRQLETGAKYLQAACRYIYKLQIFAQKDLQRKNRDVEYVNDSGNHSPECADGDDEYFD